MYKVTKIKKERRNFKMNNTLKMLPPKKDLETLKVLKQLIKTNRALAELKRMCKSNTKSKYFNKCNYYK